MNIPRKGARPKGSTRLVIDVLAANQLVYQPLAGG
jgi:hypothetical protein